MSELERLDEALAFYGDPDSYTGHEQQVLAAARAYRDLLANGQRVEPDYEAALNMLIQEDANKARGLSMTTVRKAVDAAIGDLSVYPKEAENGPL